MTFSAEGLVCFDLVIPAKAGIHHLLPKFTMQEIDSHFRGNDEAVVTGRNPTKPKNLCAANHLNAQNFQLRSIRILCLQFSRIRGCAAAKGAALESE